MKRSRRRHLSNIKKKGSAMFKKLFHGCLGLFLILFLNGCLESKNSLPVAARDYAQSPFIGSWTTQPEDKDLDTDFLTVFHEDKADYLTAIFADKKLYEPTAEAVAEAKADKDTELYHVTFSILNGVMFANVFMLENNTPDYAIVKVAMDGAEAFRSWDIKDESIEAQAKSQMISEEGTSVIALEPERLAEFVAGFKDEDYKEPRVYKRIQ
jgi:hypothetical protein